MYAVAGAGQEPAEPAGLDYHIAAAHVALLLGDLVGNLQIYACLLYTSRCV